jgi:methionyl-tRNA formyltransferase
MRLVYLGTPEASVPPLRALAEAGHDIDLVITRPDKRRGRGGALSPSPVKQAAIDLGIPVSHHVDDAVESAASGSELGVVVAFGQIIKPHVLRALPMVNLHFSLLPRWRGAAPVERAILAGDDVTGVCVMAVEDGLDTGGTYACRDVAIGADTTADELRRGLVAIGSELLVEQLADPLDDWLGQPMPQVGEPTYAAKLSTADLEIDWSGPVEQIDRQIRVGGAWTTFRDKRLKVHSATVVDGVLVPGHVQPEGKSAMPFEAWRNGARPRPGEPFGST